jgi:hypothetical protein
MITTVIVLLLLFLNELDLIKMELVNTPANSKASLENVFLKSVQN